MFPDPIFVRILQKTGKRSVIHYLAGNPEIMGTPLWQVERWIFDWGTPLPRPRPSSSILPYPY